MIPDDFRRLVAAGLSTDQIAVVMEMMDRDARAHADADEARKAKGRERVQRWREQRNVTETQPKVTVPLTGEGARVEDITSNSEDNHQEQKERTSPKASAGVREFSEALPELEGERLKAFVAHRRVKRAAFTGHAADLFRKDAANCGLSIADAADLAMSRNWITVKPDWLDKPPARGAPSHPVKDTAANAARRRLELITNERDRSLPDDHQPPAGLIPFHAQRTG